MRNSREESGLTYATSDKYIEEIARHENDIEKANMRLLEARKTEIHRLFDYFWDNEKDHKVDVTLRDTVCDLELIVKQALNIK